VPSTHLTPRSPEIDGHELSVETVSKLQSRKSNLKFKQKIYLKNFPAGGTVSALLPSRGGVGPFWLLP